LSAYLGAAAPSAAAVAVYASGGYLYPQDDLRQLEDEIRALLGQGYTHVKIKIGSVPLAQDLRRVEAASALLPYPEHLAVDAMNAYDAQASLVAAKALAPHRLWWLEDVCDPLDFETLAALARGYDGPLAAGEALFSAAEAVLLARHGGLRCERDILQFDPVHCYGIPGYLRIVERLAASGWPRRAFWPHGGHLFCLHLVSSLGLGGAEVNPFAFQPFGGLSQKTLPLSGRAAPPEVPGIGFEEKPELYRLMQALA
ncbi:MAG TPA: enolase C-terminal domain-like protein, partial [Thermoanaerobaculia bacterium]|nr:enolase C-terminal domain-like protein [Thermoanaerobaculia bacterium]